MTLSAAIPAPVIVSTADMSDIEQSKENIQPMRHGHHVEKLVQALQQQSGTPTATADDTAASTTRTERLAAERQQCEQQIKSYTGDDPLSPWLDYVKWTMDSYPILQSNDSAILPLLEKLTRKFLPTKQYHNDRRYIQIWLMYANSVKQPLDIYQYMHTNHIGTQLALLYEAHSNALLDRHRYSDAQTVLQHGIDCSAQPMKNLRVAMRRLEARQKRYEEQKALKTAEEGHDQLIDSENAGVQRQHLGTVSGSSRDENAAPVQQPQRAVQRPAPTANNAFRNISQRPPLAQQNRPAVSDSKHNFSVFTEEQSEQQNDFKRNGLFIASDATPSSWSNLSTQADLSKENTRQTSTWNEPLQSTKLSAEQQNDAAWQYVHANKRVPAAAPVDVFVEDELEAAGVASSSTSDAHPVSANDQPAKRGLRTELETTSVRSFTAALEANPLKYLQKNAAKAKPVAPTAPSAVTPRATPVAGATQQQSQPAVTTRPAASVQLRPTSAAGTSIALKPATGALSSQSVTSQLRNLISKPIAASAGNSKALESVTYR